MIILRVRRRSAVGLRNVHACLGRCDAYRTHPSIIQIKPEASYVKDEPTILARNPSPTAGQTIVRFALIPFLLLAVPLAEIAVFVLVGGRIGVMATLGLVLVTAIAGAILLRIQGFGAMERIRRTLEADEMPGRDLVHGVMILVAGILLLTPGFVTDTLGFLLFVPAIREIGWRFLRQRIVVHTVHGRASGPQPRNPSGGPTIDLDEDDYSSTSSDRRSPWLKKDE
jgi:UPF0716 protein FxsA